MAAARGTSATRLRYTGPYAELVNAAAARERIDPLLLAAVLSVESIDFDPDVVQGRRDSPAGAVGIAQIHAPSHPNVTRAQATDPTFAIPWAARFLAELRERGGSITAALRYYNTGRFERSRAADRYVKLVTERRSKIARERSGLERAAAAVRSLFAYPLGVAARLGGGPAEHKTRPIGNWWSDNAVDLMAPGGTPVVAVEDLTIGSITRRAPNGRGVADGSTIFATGASGERYAFLHLDPAIPVRTGQRVPAGAAIGRLGRGTAGGDHLHFATERADPLALVQRLQAVGGPGATVDGTLIGFPFPRLPVTGVTPGTVDVGEATIDEAKERVGSWLEGYRAVKGFLEDPSYAALYVGFMALGLGMIYVGVNQLFGRSAGADAQLLAATVATRGRAAA